MSPFQLLLFYWLGMTAMSAGLCFWRDRPRAAIVMGAISLGALLLVVVLPLIAFALFDAGQNDSAIAFVAGAFTLLAAIVVPTTCLLAAIVFRRQPNSSSVDEVSSAPVARWLQEMRRNRKQ